MMRIAPVAVLVLVVLGGCVTESSGGLPPPQSTENRVKAQLDLARGYLENGNLEQSRATLNKALKIDSRAVEVHVLLAVINEAEGEFELAEQHFKEALAVDPKNSQALNNYGSFLFNRGRYDEAVARLQVLVKDPDYRARSQAYENLGMAQLRTGARQQARESFSRSLQLSFEQPRSSLELAQMAYDDRDFDAAAGYYDSFRSQAAQSARSLCLGMKISQVSGNTDALASYAMALNNLFPNSRETDQCIVPK